MRNRRQKRQRQRNPVNPKLGKIMQCLCSGEQSQRNEVVPSESPATKDYTPSIYSSQPEETERKPDTGNIEEAETSLRESGSLNNEEARALLGRYEYQKGNIEAALHVFEGIDMAAVIPKIKIMLSKRVETSKRKPRGYQAPPMLPHAVGLLFEAFFLKAKSLQALGRYKEAAQSCSVVLDIVESSVPTGLPEKFGADSKMQEIVNRAIELLPELWKLADSSHESILSYRRALLHQWNLDAQTSAKVQKDFAVFLLYSGAEAIPPDLRSQMDGAFVPKNNIEEAILLLMILLRKASLERIEWDPSILDHLSYALSISGGFMALANQVEELRPRVIDQKERDHILALCYHAEGDDSSALYLWKQMFKTKEGSKYLLALLFASKIYGESSNYVEEGATFAHRTVENLQGACDQLMGAAHCMLGLSLSALCRSSVTDSERDQKKSEAIKYLETAATLTKRKDPTIIYHLCLENAEQRKLDAAHHYAKVLLKLEGWSSVRGWILLARILSAQKCFSDAEAVVNTALDQTGLWDQGQLLRTKAKLQIAQGLVNEAIETYSQLLAILHVQNKSFHWGKKIKDHRNHIKHLVLETWHDLATIYIKMSWWRDAELCLSKIQAVGDISAVRWHTTGLLHQARGQYKRALVAYELALEIDPSHVPSLVSKATILKQMGSNSPAIIRSFLSEALRLDRMNASAWHNLGVLYRDGGRSSAREAAECFQAAAVLEETEPVEPFR